MIVADASVILELLLRTDRGTSVDARLFKRGETIHAPSLMDLEVAQVLRRYVSRGDVTAAHGRTAIDLLSRLPVDRYTHEPLLPRIWDLRENFTAFDAAYVALAEALRAPLLTCDARLARAPGIRTTVELIT